MQRLQLEKLSSEETVEKFLKENEIIGLTRLDVHHLYKSWASSLYSQNLTTEVMPKKINNLILHNSNLKLYKDFTGSLVSSSSRYRNFKELGVSCVVVYGKIK